MTSGYSIIRRLIAENHDIIVKSYPKTALLLLIMTGISPLIAWLSAKLVSGALDGITQSEFLFAGCLIGGLFVVRGGVTYLHAIIIAGTGNKVIARLQRRVFDALTDGQDPQTPDFDSARAATRIVHGARAARIVLEQLFTSLLKDVLMLAALIAVMIYHEPALALITGAIIPLIIFAGHVLRRRQRDATQSEFSALSEIVSTAQDVVAGGRIIRAFNARNHFLARAQSAISTVQKQASKIAATTSATTPIIEIVAGLVMVAIFAVTDIQSKLAVDEREAFLTFLAATVMAFQPIKSLTRLNVSITNGLTNLGNMYAFIDRASARISVPADGKELAAGRIEFTEVTFGYNPAEPVFQGLSFTAEAGQITALIGPSGCGKTTILSLVEQFIAPQSGQIVIGGHRLNPDQVTNFGDQIALVTQDTFLFRGTIAENITCGLQSVSVDEIRQAAQHADADAFITALPEGYETLVGGEMLTLSAGQRQRLAIARAILRDPPVLLLDEATSALDPVTEARVIDAIQKLTAGRTTILVTHNMSLLRQADRILRMDETGHIAEFPHADLDHLTRQHGG